MLGRSKTPVEALAALKVYDQVRRPRTQRIVDSSRSTGYILTGRGELKLNMGLIKEKLLPSWDFIVDLESERHSDEALELMEQELKKKPHGS